MKMPRMLLCLLSTSIFCAACAPWASYPPVETTAKFTKATYEPIPTLMTEGIRCMNERYGEKSGDFAFNLPAGTPAKVYDTVIQRLGGGHPLSNPAEPAYHITQVRSRDLDGEVDVIFPGADGVYQSATIKLHKELVGPYQVTDVRIWHFPVQPPAPNYPPPMPEGEPQTKPAS
ncbi:MAG TPA: hypothetical protein VG711_09240 [Phycisphaerales bacterium]|nr:hypothetical protein [Phycisphaerales bacterium]